MLRYVSFLFWTGRPFLFFQKNCCFQTNSLDDENFNDEQGKALVQLLRTQGEQAQQFEESNHSSCWECTTTRKFISLGEYEYARVNGLVFYWVQSGTRFLKEDYSPKTPLCLRKPCLEDYNLNNHEIRSVGIPGGVVNCMVADFPLVYFLVDNSEVVVLDVKTKRQTRYSKERAPTLVLGIAVTDKFVVMLLNTNPRQLKIVNKRTAKPVMFKQVPECSQIINGLTRSEFHLVVGVAGSREIQTWSEEFRKGPVTAWPLFFSHLFSSVLDVNGRTISVLNTQGSLLILDSTSKVTSAYNLTIKSLTSDNLHTYMVLTNGETIVWDKSNRREIHRYPVKQSNRVSTSDGLLYITHGSRLSIFKNFNT